MTPLYPVAAFSHQDGIAIGSGYVYRGTLMPRMVGKYIFTDIASGRVFYADLAEMLDARATTPAKLAAINEIQIVYQGPGDGGEGRGQPPHVRHRRRCVRAQEGREERQLRAARRSRATRRD